MPEPATNLTLEIGHVLFIDLVGYSKLLIDEQLSRFRQLTDIVLATPQVARSVDERLIRLPTGDGMALVFRKNAEEPAQCALEIARALQAHPEIAVRMGVNSGPISDVLDVSGKPNIVGAGINMAQRVMDCGDAGHILISGRTADDLGEYRHWQSTLHDLGECEVKHGVRLRLANLYKDGLGNPCIPEKIACAKPAQPGRRKAGLLVSAVAGAAVIALVAFLFATKRSSSIGETAFTPAADIPPKSIAVLPFANLSDNPENAFFTDGVQDEILTHLAKVADLKVISRTSVLQYKTSAPRNLREIGRQLGVAHLLEGSVQRVANKVRVNAQLIDARTDSHLWAQIYDRDLADVFAIQSEIATAIADQLRAKISPVEKAAIQQQPTSDLEAFEQYSRARTLLVTGLTTAQEKSFLQAVTLLDSAVARDPSFYAAFCQLVFVNDSLYSGGYDHTPARLATAEAALARVAQLRPDAPETHLARGQHLYYALRDYGGALAELELAGRGLPNDARVFETKGYILRRRGNHEEALRALEQAIERDPRNVFTLAQIALSYQLLRRYPDEGRVLDRMLEITPEDAALASSRAGIELLGRADTRPLQQLIARLRTERPTALGDVASDWYLYALADHDWRSCEDSLNAMGDTPFLNDWSVKLSRQFAEGLLARAMGDEARAQRAFTAARAEQEQIVARQSDFGPALCVLALIDAALGNRDAALAEGRRAMELLPIAKDPSGGQRLAAYFAITAAWSGEKDLALQHLEAAGPTPGGSTIASYGFLKLLPFWQPLRGDPRFEKIVASLAPTAPAK
jgi:TolB-like protein/Tfp pilus assembly protein PilF